MLTSLPSGDCPLAIVTWPVIGIGVPAGAVETSVSTVAVYSAATWIGAVPTRVLLASSSSVASPAASAMAITQ